MSKIKKISRMEEIFTLVALLIGISIIYFYIFFAYLKNEEIAKPISKTQINRNSTFETHKLLKNEKYSNLSKDANKNFNFSFEEKDSEINKFRNEIEKNNFHLSLLKEELKSSEERFNIIENKQNDLILKLQQEGDLNKRKELQIEQIQLKKQYNKKNHLVENIKEIKRKNIFLEINIKERIQKLKFEKEMQKYLI